MSAFIQISRLIYAPRGDSGGNCCNYRSNYEARKYGLRCRVCGCVYRRLPKVRENPVQKGGAS